MVLCHKSFFEILLVVVSMLFLIFSLWNNIGVTFDSRLYLAGSVYIGNSGFTDIFSQAAFRAKPPLFSTVLFLLGNDFLAVTVLNIICFAGILILSFRLVDKIIENKFYNRIAKFQVAFSPSFFLVHNFIWTEPLFILLLTMYLLVIFTFLKKGDKSHKCLIWLSLLGILLVLHRHVGIIFVIFTGAYLFVFLKGSLRQAVFTAIPILVFVLWQYLLWEETDSLRRMDHTAGLDVFRNTSYFMQSFSTWFFPLVPGFKSIVPLFIMPSLLIFIGVVQIAFKTRIDYHFRQYLFFLMIVYIIIMDLKGELFYSDIERYLSAIYIPFIILFLLSIEKIAKGFPKLLLTTNFILVLWSLYTFIRSIKNILFWGGVSL